MGGGIAMNFANVGIPRHHGRGSAKTLSSAASPGGAQANYERSAKNGRFKRGRG